MESGKEPAAKADLKADLSALEGRIFESLRDMQNEMLKAFYFGESNDRGGAQNEVNELADRSRIETLERRVTELEQRLNIPPAA